MGDRHDYVALEWVKGEIAETLKQAHHAIETQLDDPQATHALSECLACICLLYTSPSPRDGLLSRMPSSA